MKEGGKNWRSGCPKRETRRGDRVGGETEPGREPLEVWFGNFFDLSRGVKA
jgi:hypothetical protein